MTSIPTVTAIELFQPPTQLSTIPSATLASTTLHSSFYDTCVADTIQNALESGTTPDISWCSRWNNEDNGPAMPTPRPTTRAPETQRPLLNTVQRTRAPVEKGATQSYTSLAPDYIGMPRTTQRPTSVILRPQISQILSRAPTPIPIYVAPTRAPEKPIISPATVLATAAAVIATASPTLPPTSTSNAIGQAQVPTYPIIVSLVHEDEWMRRGTAKFLTLRNSKLTLEDPIPKDLSQMFTILNGQIRCVDGQGNNSVNIDGVGIWQFTSRQLKGSFNIGNEKKWISYDTSTKSVLLSLNQSGPANGWFIIPLGRLS
jgi:hypothetical protein